MDLKRCSKCGQQKLLAEFRETTKHSKPYRYSHCNDCQRAYGRAHYKKNKAYYSDKAAARNQKVRDDVRDFLLSVLLENPCADCGEDDLVVLQFDHVRGEKLNDISNLVRRAATLEVVKAEVEKCEVVCANCHQRRTARQFGWWTDALVAQRIEQLTTNQ